MRWPTKWGPWVLANQEKKASIQGKPSRRARERVSGSERMVSS